MELEPGSPRLPEDPSASPREDSPRPAASSESPADPATRGAILPTALAFEAVALALAFLLKAAGGRYEIEVDFDG